MRLECAPASFPCRRRQPARCSSPLQRGGMPGLRLGGPCSLGSSGIAENESLGQRRGREAGPERGLWGNLFFELGQVVPMSGTGACSLRSGRVLAMHLPGALPGSLRSSPGCEFTREREGFCRTTETWSRWWHRVVLGRLDIRGPQRCPGIPATDEQDGK